MLGHASQSLFGLLSLVFLVEICSVHSKSASNLQISRRTFKRAAQPYEESFAANPDDVKIVVVPEKKSTGDDTATTVDEKGISYMPGVCFIVMLFCISFVFAYHSRARHLTYFVL